MPAPVAAAAPQLQPQQLQPQLQATQSLDSQQPTPDSSPATTSAIPPTADIPANLQIPETAAATAVPPAPAATPAEVAKAAVEAPPPPPAPPTPAEILGLTGKDRAKAEKCLANAVYFEARGEPLRGQIAVAQVVMNRVFSPYYPKDVCSVVYQNAERYLSCQFTFACDGKSKATHDRGAWWRAQRVAKQTLDGKVWLASVAKSTHYHAYWVNPAWVAEMKKMFRYGVHTFYRPHRWGDGEQEAGWVNAPLPVLAPKPVGNLPKPQAANERTTPATITPAVASTAPQPAKTMTVTPAKIDAKAADAKAAASKLDAKVAPVKINAKKSDEKKPDVKVSPIYTDGKKSELKTLPANVQAKSLPAANTSKSSAKRSQSKPAAKGHAKSADKLSLR